MSRQTVSENIDGQMSVVSGSGYRRSQCSYLTHEVEVRSVTVTTRPHAPFTIVDHSAVSPDIVIVVVEPLGVIDSRPVRPAPVRGAAGTGQTDPGVLRAAVSAGDVFGYEGVQGYVMDSNRFRAGVDRGAQMCDFIPVDYVVGSPPITHIAKLGPFGGGAGGGGGGDDGSQQSQMQSRRHGDGTEVVHPGRRDA